MNERKTTVAKVVDRYTVILNKGARDGIRTGQRFLIYAFGDEDIIDPETKENLGRVEIVKGTGKVTHVQDKLATVASDMEEFPGTTTRSLKLADWAASPFAVDRIEVGPAGPEGPVGPVGQFGSASFADCLAIRKVPFQDVEYGDYARPI